MAMTFLSVEKISTSPLPAPNRIYDDSQLPNESVDEALERTQREFPNETPRQYIQRTGRNSESEAQAEWDQCVDYWVSSHSITYCFLFVLPPPPPSPYLSVFLPFFFL